MTIVFFSNYLNHHLVQVFDELYNLTDRNFYFVATTSMPKFRKTLGYEDYSDRPYLIKAFEDKEQLAIAKELSVCSDVAIFGGITTLVYEKERLKRGLLTFNCSERWLKKGIINVLSPKLLKYMYYYFKYTNLNHFKLCSSAFAASDHLRLGMFRNRCFKWGYFPMVNKKQDCLTMKGKEGEKVRLLWCARLIKLKHPELPILLAKKLKNEGYCFELNMYGNGEDYDNCLTLIKKHNLEDVVHLKGAVKNSEVLDAMKRHDIFLFTSDRREGWGAVTNEAMSNACVVVGSDKIGSIPFLIKDGENGCIFESGSLNSLYQKAKWLLDNPEIRYKLSIQSFKTITELWSPQVAANNLIKLSECLLLGKESPIKEGPCSKV